MGGESRDVVPRYAPPAGRPLGRNDISTKVNLLSGSNGFVLAKAVTRREILCAEAKDLECPKGFLLTPLVKEFIPSLAP
jgi:hypothetical protein